MRLIDINHPEENKGDNKVIPYDIEFDLNNGHSFSDVLKRYYAKVKPFDAVEFKNGYNKNSPRMLVEFKGLDVGKAIPEWSENWKGDAFRIKLGEIYTISK